MFDGGPSWSFTPWVIATNGRVQRLYRSRIARCGLNFMSSPWGLSEITWTYFLGSRALYCHSTGCFAAGTVAGKQPEVLPFEDKWHIHSDLKCNLPVGVLLLFISRNVLLIPATQIRTRMNTPALYECKPTAHHLIQQEVEQIALSLYQSLSLSTWDGSKVINAYEEEGCAALWPSSARPQML